MNGSVELLAPAGSMMAFKAAINAGADAIYVGGNRFNAREYAANFSNEELLNAIDIAHLRGVKVYLTLNTLLKGKELKEVPSFIAPFYEAGIDAVLVQDLGVLSLLRESFPDLPLHSSTQMSISNVYGASLMKKLGVSRVVTSRELSLQEIARIRKEADIEVETFIHGAMCYSYSGHCLMSSMLGGRSGNRGRCAGTCRLPFIFDPVGSPKKDSAGKKDGTIYPLSIKDLCTIDILPDIVAAGVSSLKIEGRMKSPEYVAGVVSIYRKYLDMLNLTAHDETVSRLSSSAHDETVSRLRENFRVDEKDKKALFDLGNRTGFTKGYYFVHNDKDMVTFDSPSHTTAGEEILKKRYGNISEAPLKKIPVTGSFICKSGEEICFKVRCGDGYEFTAYGPKPGVAENKPLNKETVMDKLSATGESDFEFSDIDVIIDDGLFIPLKALKQIRRDALAGLAAEMLKSHKRAWHKSDQTETSGIADARRDDDIITSGVACSGKEKAIETSSVSIVKREQFDEILKCKDISRIYVDTMLYDLSGINVKNGINDTNVIKSIENDIKRTHEVGKEYYVKLPVIFRRRTSVIFEELIDIFEEAGADGYLCGSFDSLAFMLEKVNLKTEAEENGIEEDGAKKDRHVTKVMADAGLYTYSDRAKEAYRKLGVTNDTVPYELNKKELKHRYNSESEMIIYGRIPLMVSAGCTHKNLRGCDKKKTTEYLKDRKGKVFPVINNCNDCLNTLYNADILDLSDEEKTIEDLGIKWVRINLTTEDSRETAKVLNDVFGKLSPDSKGRESKKGNTKENIKEAVAFTKGHFNRGVE